ncbi:MAG: DUF1849 family protein [Geminicoccaceae bacterium]|nr:MAG: DUF1849 family protein [Geminicoccaceae bacterium]
MVNLSRTFGLAMPVVLLIGSGPAAAQLTPHRALYQLSLAEAGGGLAQASGAFAIEWRAGCEGYTTQQRLWFQGATDDGGLFDSDVRFSSWESADRTTLRFTMRSFAQGEVVEEFRGTATVPGDGMPGVAVYVLPEAGEMVLPPSTIFPTEHLRQLLATAKAGGQVVSHDVFDGSGHALDALAAVTAIIGQPSFPLEDEDEGELESWRVALAYHDPSDFDAGVPVFELRFVLTEKGLMHDVHLDYGDFALKAKLDQMAWLPWPECP